MIPGSSSARVLPWVRAPAPHSPGVWRCPDTEDAAFIFKESSHEDTGTVFLFEKAFRYQRERTYLLTNS